MPTYIENLCFKTVFQVAEEKFDFERKIKLYFKPKSS